MMYRMYRVVATAVVAAVLAAAAPVGAEAGASRTERWVVEVRPGAELDGLDVVEAIPGADFVLVESAGAPDHPAVVDARPSVTVLAAAPPDDPLYEHQWHLRAVRADEAWDVSTGDGVVVAVLDTGVAFEDSGVYRRAPDLAQTVFERGWDFVNGDSRPNDDNGHGTHVTGVIAQSTNNTLGGAGLAFGARIMPVKVLDDEGSGSDFHIAAGIRWAADQGAQVVNMSFSAVGLTPVVTDAIEYAHAKGVVLVSASGNESGPIAYPAAYPQVISVGAVGPDGNWVGYSNFGPTLDLVAPGGDLSVDRDGNGNPDGILQQSFDDGPQDFCFCLYEGTSMAAPLVSAAAALLIAQGHATTPEVIRRVLTTSALDVNTPGRDDRTGYGMLDAPAALAAGAQLTPVFRTFLGGARPTGSACPTGGVPEDGFADVVDTNAHEPMVDCMVWRGIATGRSATTYDPAVDVTRAQTASFLARLMEAGGTVLPLEPPNAFGDDEGNAHELRINQLAALSVIGGTGPGVFSPDRAVTRAQMASLLVRVAEELAGPLGPATGDRFDDDEGSVHEPAADLAAELGLAAGTGERTYAPDRPVRRDHMASFLARVLDLLVEAGLATSPA